jgi:hypothetical protein
VDAAFSSGIDLEATFRKPNVTVDAATIMTLLETLERAGAGLSLQGIHARKASHSTLIEHHRGLRVFPGSIDFVEFSSALTQAGKKA